MKFCQGVDFYFDSLYNISCLVRKYAGVLELADEADSKSVGLIIRAGSTPATGMKLPFFGSFLYAKTAVSHFAKRLSL